MQRKLENQVIFQERYKSKKQQHDLEFTLQMHMILICKTKSLEDISRKICPLWTTCNHFPLD
jgi:hypothetical protein